MIEILQSVVDKLFEHIPFSRDSEELKKNVNDQISAKYEKEASETEDIAKAGEIIAECKNLESVCGYVGIENVDISSYINSDQVLTGSDAKKILRKSKRYIYVLSFLIAAVFQLVVTMICHFTLKVIIADALMIILICALGFFIWQKAKKYLKDIGFLKSRFDASGRNCIYNFQDKYTKKYMNTSMAFIAVIAYVVIALLLCVCSSKYTLYEVYEQLSYMSFLLQVAMFLHVKNFLCKRLTDVFFIKEKKKEFLKHFRTINFISFVYFVVIAAFLIIRRNQIENIFKWVLFFGVIYFAGCIVYDLIFRKNIVFKNIVVNIKRIVCISMIVILGLTYNVMSMDLYLTQPYINTVSKMLNQKDRIEYNEENGIYTITTKKDDFKILQLTDIHLGGSFMSYSKDMKALEACYKLIETTRPDLVVVTGDMVFPMGVMSFSLNNSAPIMQFAAFMRNTEIPWVFTYGNHDTESMATLNVSEFDSLMKSLSFKSSGNLLYPYVQPDIYGRSNQIVEIRNADGTLMQDLFLLDSNDYCEGAKGINEYDYIHDDQVDWYEKNVLSLSEKEGYTIPSLLFFHMPLREYMYANDLYESGSSEVKYFYGTIGETAINRICCSEHDSKLFDTAVRLGSTKAMFCGHDHYNNESLEYKGIRLTYGYSIDYLAMPGIEEDVEQRGATVIKVNKSGNYDIQPVRLMDIQ